MIRRALYATRPRPSAAALCLVLVISRTAAADHVVLTPLKDNSLFSESNTLSNGMGVGLFAGVTGSGAIRRALVAFDVPGAIPAGATITSAQLTLHVTSSISGSETVALHRLLADWGEGMSNSTVMGGGMGAPATTGDATWRFRFFNSEQWSSSGGDFAAAASATQQVPNSGAVTWGSTAQMVTDVQGWLDLPQANFGWLVRGNETGTTTTKRYASRESAEATRPRLVIEFQPPGGGATATATVIVALTETPTRTQTPLATHTPVATDTRSASPTVQAPTPTQPVQTATPTEPSIVTPTDTAVMTETATPTETPALPSPTSTGTAGDRPTSTPTPPVVVCVGNCDGGGTVTINELIVGVNIALGRLSIDQCPAFDPSDNGGVEINELIAAVNSALNGCASGSLALHKNW